MVLHIHHFPTKKLIIIPLFKKFMWIHKSQWVIENKTTLKMGIICRRKQIFYYLIAKDKLLITDVFFKYPLSLSIQQRYDKNA